MKRPAGPRVLRLLHLEDSPLDHELTLAQLRRGGVEAVVVRVDNEPDFLRAIEEPWDAVISDYNLPGFSGLVALDLLKASGRAIPFILLSGEIGEETAVEAMRNGAADYVLKNKPARLVPALLHAVRAHDDRRARTEADRELHASRERLRELAQHLQTSVEAERAAIAREIHDDVGGSLTAIKFDLAWIARHTDSHGVLQRVHSALETVTHAIEASQRIMHNLRPAILEQGLVAALQWMAARFERRSGIDCRLQVPPALGELPPGVALTAYRTAQEALTNVSKHARATEVRIDLTVGAGVLTLEIADNGCGLTPDDLAKSRSFGLRGLHERAGVVGGWVDLTSGADGTTLILSVPLHGAAGRGLGDDAQDDDEGESPAAGPADPAGTPARDAEDEEDAAARERDAFADPTSWSALR